MAPTGETYFADEVAWRALLSALGKDYELFGPKAVKDAKGRVHVRLSRVAPAEVVLAQARMVDPLKAFLFQAREDLGGYFAGRPPAAAARRAIVGVTGCDLASLAVMDYVFLQGEVVDPQYRLRREATFIVSQDCTAPWEVCFCVGVGGWPYPLAGYDVNVSPIEGGMLLAAGSERGEALLAGRRLPRASPRQVADRDRLREEVTERVKTQAAAFGLPVSPAEFQKHVSAGVDHPVWKEQARTCVECGACNFICPTCHCFLLVDLEAAGQFRRFKNWDACQYAGFSRVAGGANPRPKRWERLRNRFDKKFNFFVTHLAQPACTGCGRCIEACPGKIDLREILKTLAAGAESVVPGAK